MESDSESEGRLKQHSGHRQAQPEAETSNWQCEEASRSKTTGSRRLQPPTSPLDVPARPRSAGAHWPSRQPTSESADGGVGLGSGHGPRRCTRGGLRSRRCYGYLEWRPPGMCSFLIFLAPSHWHDLTLLYSPLPLHSLVSCFFSCRLSVGGQASLGHRPQT